MLPQNLHTIMLAPMAELSHRALRELIEGFKADKTIYFTEMISAAGLLDGGSMEKWYLDNGPCPQRLVYQLLGADEDRLVKAAELLDRQDCLGIDINMGCCAPLIAKTGAGIRWMEDPDRAARLVQKLRGITRKQLSVKIRLGPKTARERLIQPETTATDQLPYFPKLFDFCRKLENAGLDMIILHPRLAAEKFKRRARWEYVEALRKKLKIPLVGNGDINNADELAAKAAEGPVMAGRLLLREPWAFAQANQILWPQASPGEASDVVQETGIRFLELLAKYQPPEFHISRARRFFKYYCDNLTWAEYLRNKINREETLGGIDQVWREYFAEDKDSGVY